MRLVGAVTADHFSLVPRTYRSTSSSSRGLFYFAWGCFRDFVSGSAVHPHSASKTRPTHHALGPDIVDQARLSKLCRNQNSHRPVLHRGHRRKTVGVPRLEIVEDETGVGDEFSAAGHRSLDVLARPQMLGAFLYGAIERRRH